MNYVWQEVNMNLAKFDELDSLIRGMLYIETTNPHECYYWSNPTDDSKCQKVPYDFSEPYPFLVSVHGNISLHAILILKEVTDRLYPAAR